MLSISPHCISAPIYPLPSPLPAETKTCDMSHFTCGSGRCIPKTWLCDGDRDCHGDGEVGDDEQQAVCGVQALQCDSDSFRCLSGGSVGAGEGGDRLCDVMTAGRGSNGMVAWDGGGGGREREREGGRQINGTRLHF